MELTYQLLVRLQFTADPTSEQLEQLNSATESLQTGVDNSVLSGSAAASNAVTSGSNAASDAQTNAQNFCYYGQEMQQLASISNFNQP